MATSWQEGQVPGGLMLTASLSTAVGLILKWMDGRSTISDGWILLRMGLCCNQLKALSVTVFHIQIFTLFTNFALWNLKYTPALANITAARQSLPGQKSSEHSPTHQQTAVNSIAICHDLTSSTFFMSMMCIMHLLPVQSFICRNVLKGGLNPM